MGRAVVREAQEARVAAGPVEGPVAQMVGADLVAAARVESGLEAAAKVASLGVAQTADSEGLVALEEPETAELTAAGWREASGETVAPGVAVMAEGEEAGMEA